MMMITLRCHRKVISPPVGEEDNDVAAERARILSGHAEDVPLKIDSLTKVYSSNGGSCTRSSARVAVNQFCLGLDKAEVCTKHYLTLVLSFYFFVNFLRFPAVIYLFFLLLLLYGLSSVLVCWDSMELARLQCFVCLQATLIHLMVMPLLMGTV